MHTIANPIHHTLTRRSSPTDLVLLLVTVLSTDLCADGLPLTTCQLPDFIGSGECAFCHSALKDTANNDLGRG